MARMTPFYDESYSTNIKKLMINHSNHELSRHRYIQLHNLEAETNQDSGTPREASYLQFNVIMPALESYGRVWGSAQISNSN